MAFISKAKVEIGIKKNRKGLSNILRPLLRYLSVANIVNNNCSDIWYLQN